MFEKHLSAILDTKYPKIQLSNFIVEKLRKQAKNSQSVSRRKVMSNLIWPSFNKKAEKQQHPEFSNIYKF